MESKANRVRQSKSHLKLNKLNGICEMKCCDITTENVKDLIAVCILCTYGWYNCWNLCSIILL